ncbi:SN2, partial [Linum grandiflorum]
MATTTGFRGAAIVCLLFILIPLLAQPHEFKSYDFPTHGAGFLTKMDCGSACAGRCQLASRHRMCIRACGTCCARCNCVPPGTSGNREVCPCYAKMTTHGGRLKC